MTEQRYDTDLVIAEDVRERVVTSWRDQAAIIESMEWRRFKPVWSQRSIMRDEGRQAIAKEVQAND